MECEGNIVFTASQQYSNEKDLNELRISSQDIRNSFRKVKEVENFCIINITKEISENNNMKVFNILKK